MKTSDFDKNFKVKSTIDKTNMTAYDVCEQPFKIYGLMLPSEGGGIFRRMPEEVAKATNEGVHFHHVHTAGGRVRFVTNSKNIAIHAEMIDIGKMPHFALTGSAGFDLYKKTKNADEYKYQNTFTPPFDIENGFESKIACSEGEMCEYTLNFPTYSGVSSLYIYLDNGAELKAASPYTYEKPVVYYGSSITQGGCCSRPGNAYQSIISRLLDCDFVNLGFSGSARGENAIAEYIASLDMSIFVYDYDHNAPDPDHLAKTHEKMFKTVRAAQPQLPIICVSRPGYAGSEDSQRRREIIIKTVENAKNAGDNNVYFIDGGQMYPTYGIGESESVDGCHPNDLGFMCMARAMLPIIKQLLEN